MSDHKVIDNSFPFAFKLYISPMIPLPILSHIMGPFHAKFILHEFQLLVNLCNNLQIQ